jgi:hypothetical protein
MSELSREWFWLYNTLGTPTPEEVRGNVFAIAIHATGWAGIAACALAPSLKNRYYLALCVLMIIPGLFHDCFVAIRRTQPLAVAYVTTRALLREYKTDYRPDEERIEVKLDSAKTKS